MTIAFCSIGLTPPPDAQSRVYQYWHGQRIREFDHPGFRERWLNHLPIPTEPEQECPRIGALNWRTGASRWATCHLVASDTQLAAIRTALGSPATSGLLEFSDGTNTISAQMWLLAARPIHQRGDDELYLLTLVDDRWYWWQEGNQAVAEDPATWAELLAALFTSVGEAPTIPTVPSAYLTPTGIRWNVGYKPIPILLDAAAASVGFRIIRQLDGTVTVQTAAAATTADDSAWTTYATQVLSGGRLAPEDLIRGIPEKVTTVFWGDPPFGVTKTLASLSLAAYSGLTAPTDTTSQVVADVGSGLTSSGQMTAYAVQAATDYYDWALSRSDYTLRGFWDRPLNGNDAFVEWVHRPDQLVTRVVRQTLSDMNLYGDRPPTIRLPVELTSTFNNSSGYSWKRLTEDTDLAPAVYVPASIANTGNYLFEVNDNRSLQPPLRAVMFSNPDGYGWQFQQETLSRTICVGGTLYYQESYDGGLTWTNVTNLGLPCNSGSGSGSGSGSLNPCANCFGSGHSGEDPYQVAEVFCSGGVLYVISAQVAIVYNATTGRIEQQQYNWGYTTAGCCDCAGGSGSGSGSGSGGGGTLPPGAQDCDSYLSQFTGTGLNIDAVAVAGVTECHTTMTLSSASPPVFITSACTGAAVTLYCSGQEIILDVSSTYTGTSNEIYHMTSGTVTPFRATFLVPRNRFGGPDDVLIPVVVTQP